MLPLGLFRSRNFSGANLLTLLLYAALGGALFFLPFNLIQVQGYSADRGGRRPPAVRPPHVPALALVRRAGRRVRRRGCRSSSGPLVAALGFRRSLPARHGRRLLDDFFPAVVVLGLGMAVRVAPLR